ncbi:unnamed protein product [Tetraodon nigroviridis]|uniref:Chromosome 1 SCAF14573, whole genome shotgun sequence n=1 Tax=Tetraodon nigroviridis TaxID=99883 RepID=Q4SJQ1_TETNG|nr:unnamed protein product [Tetraodon nigroviridis]
MASAPAPDALPAAVSAPTLSKISLRDDLTCAVCCDLFREPVMLACMHHFCKLCICQYWGETEGRVRCPQCRQEFGSKHFQTNYLVSSIVEKIRVATSDSYIQNVQKQLREMLESHHLRKEAFIKSVSRDKDKMDAIKVRCFLQGNPGIAALNR